MPSSSSCISAVTVRPHDRQRFLFSMSRVNASKAARLNENSPAESFCSLAARISYDQVPMYPSQYSRRISNSWESGLIAIDIMLGLSLVHHEASRSITEVQAQIERMVCKDVSNCGRP